MRRRAPYRALEIIFSRQWQRASERAERGNGGVRSSRPEMKGAESVAPPARPPAPGLQCSHQTTRGGGSSQQARMGGMLQLLQDPHAVPQHQNWGGASSPPSLTHSLSQFFRNAHHHRRRPDEHSRSTTFKGRIRPHSRATSEKTRMTYCTTLFHDHECMSVCTNQCTERVRLRCVCIYKERSLLSCPHLLRLLNLTLFLRNIFPFDFSNEETTFKPEICKVLSSGILQR